jgi:hypothetical protein
MLVKSKRAILRIRIGVPPSQHTDLPSTRKQFALTGGLIGR